MARWYKALQEAFGSAKMPVTTGQMGRDGIYRTGAALRVGAEKLTWAIWFDVTDELSVSNKF